MLSLLPIFTLAQAAPIPTPTPIIVPTPVPSPQLIVQPQEVRALPGQLDQVPVFNSNSPEVIQAEGILLSTFPPVGKSAPAAHLNFPLKGRFDVFAHHIARASTPDDTRPMYLGIILSNASNRFITVDVLQAVSYLTPEAPFIDLPALVDNSEGKVYAGPGSRVMTDILKGVHQPIFPSQLVLRPGESQLLVSLPISLSNCRSTLMRLRSNGPVHVASLAMFAPLVPANRPNPAKKQDKTPASYREPKLEEWLQLLDKGNLAGPRDRVPTPPEQTSGNIVYGRVAGVAQGSHWQAEVIDDPKKQALTIPKPGHAFSYVIGTVNQVTLGTGQVQSAPMLVRYPDTAYRAHGNYGVHYSLSLPLINPTKKTQTLTLSLQTPLKEENQKDGLRFLEPPDQQQVFFRGTVQLKYKDDNGIPQIRSVHLVQRQGQLGQPLITLKMAPAERRLVQVEFLYPPDSTPPQVLTLQTLKEGAN